MRFPLLLLLSFVSLSACGAPSNVESVQIFFQPEADATTPQTQLTVSWHSDKQIALKVEATDLEYSLDDGLGPHKDATDVRSLVRIEQTGGGADGTVYFFVDRPVCFTAKYTPIFGIDPGEPVSHRYCVAS